MTKRDRNCGENTGGRGADGKFGPGNPGKRDGELMAKPKVKAKAKPKITAKEKRAHERKKTLNKLSGPKGRRGPPKGPRRHDR